MGDRANVVIQDRAQRVYLYTHYNGSELPEIVREALERKQRWDDPAYLARIIFCAMVGVDNWDAETGYGISNRICDNSYPIIVVDCDTQKVRLEAEDTPELHTQNGTPFSDFIETPAHWPVGVDA